LILWLCLSAAALFAAWRLGWFRLSSYAGKRTDAGLAWRGWLILALWLFLAQMLAGIALSAIAAGASDLTRSSLAGVGGAIGVGAVAAAALAARPSLREGGLRVRARDLWVGGAVFLGVLPLVSLTATASALLAEWLGSPVDPLAHDTLRRLREGAPSGTVALTIVAVVVAAPIAEELLYRGFIQTTLKEAGMGPVGGTLAASLLFVSIHATVLDAAMMPALLALSMVLGLSFERTGRIGTPIVAHALFNAFNLWAASAGVG
jgi:membrane protease YdiL (CAAX protease family)